MANDSPTVETVTRYAVHSVNSGTLVCGPYDDKGEANRELKRLSREAIQGRTAPSEQHPKGQELSKSREPQLMHLGQPQEYEIRTSEGIIL